MVHLVVYSSFPELFFSHIVCSDDGTILPAKKLKGRISAKKKSPTPAPTEDLQVGQCKLELTQHVEKPGIITMP